MADPVFFQVGHPYHAKVFKPNARLGETKNFRTKTDVAVRAIGRDEADLVASLGFCGAEIEVHRYEDAFWRPLIDPDNGEPITAKALGSYAYGMCAWRDNPFVQRSPNHFVEREDRRNVTAFCAGTENFYASDWRRVDESTLTSAVEEIRAKAADLLVIDGMAFVRTEPPVLLVKSDVVVAGKAGYRLTWHVPFLEGDDNQGGPTAHPFGDQSRRHPFAQYAWRKFALTDAEAADAFVRIIADARGMPREAGNGGVVIHRPDLLPEPTPCGVDAESVAWSGLMALKSRIVEFPRAQADAWLDARDLSAEGLHEDAVERLSFVVHEWGKAGRWDWKVLDFRNLASTPVMDAEAALSQVVRHKFDRERFGMTADDLAALEDIEGFGGPSP